MLRVMGVCGGCGLVAVALGAINIWLGILALPILYGIAESVLGPD